MKKFLCFIICATFLFALFGCSAPIIYEQEDEMLQWLTEHTEGYTQLSETQKRLYKDREGFSFEFRTASGGFPQPEVEYDPVSVSVRETDFVSAWVGDTKYATASSLSRVFHPYRNQYFSAMQIYRKDAQHFRVFLWLYGEDTDDYPIPRLLTKEQYDIMLGHVEIYNNIMCEKSEVEEIELVDYMEVFNTSYEAKYRSDKATNPSGELYYEYNGGAEKYKTNFQELFAKLELTPQEWRACYEELGYTGFYPVYQIVYVDITIGNTIIDMTLNTTDTYLSPALKEKNLSFTYTFCPDLAKQDFMNIVIE